MSQIIRYRNRDKGLSILLHLEGELLFGFGKILYLPTIPKDLDSYFDKNRNPFLNTY
jgi:hypothetical protein